MAKDEKKNLSISISICPTPEGMSKGEMTESISFALSLTEKQIEEKIAKIKEVIKENG